MSLVNRHRKMGLPSPIDADVLARSQISESLIPRTLQALRSLDLVNEDGSPSAVLEGIRLAPEAEYQTRLVEWLKSAYADALQFVDPAAGDETAVRDAFRSYNPVGQQGRMVTLFIGLFKAAGIWPEGERSTPRKAAAVPRATRTTSSTRTISQTRNRLRPPNAPPGHGAPPGLPPALSGLLASLPGEAGWTTAERDIFMTTFRAVLDFCFPTTERIPPTEPAQGTQ